MPTRMPDVRTLERESIRDFVETCSSLFVGARVLDYGCGKQPYRDIIEGAGGEYFGYDRREFPGNISGGDVGDWTGSWDVILCTQITQYVPDLLRLLFSFWDTLEERSGKLVMTYVTNWQEIEPGDIHRHTKSGMERLLRDAGFEVLRHERRAEVVIPGQTTGPDTFVFPLGYGVVARV